MPTDRILPTIPVDRVTYTAYMKVEDTLRYLNRRALAEQQYLITGFTNHFFKCDEVKRRIGKPTFRIMECDVVQYLIQDK